VVASHTKPRSPISCENLFTSFRPIILINKIICFDLHLKTLISLFDKVHFYIFVMLIELVRVRVRSINLNQKDIGIHSNLEAPQAPSGCHVARC
jgi:hypothetical protein